MRWTIGELRVRYLGGELSPREVVRMLAEKAEADRAWNVWITPPDPERLEPYLRRLESTNPAEAPLWGVPFAVKDNIDVAGMPTTAACPAFSYVPERNAVAVERLVAAGAVPLGKTNLDQFATGLVGTRSPYGETRNALRPELISGGSSSGSAVAVALGHAVFALSTDTAGSGRVPASLNGVYGFKPARGAWPTVGVVPACRSLDCVGVFTATAEDALAVDRVVRGPDPGDAWARRLSFPAPAGPSRVLIPDRPPVFFGPFAKKYAAAWEAALERAAQMGVPVEKIDLAMFDEASELLYDGPWIAERWAALGDFVGGRSEAVFSVTRDVLSTGAPGRYDAVDLFRAVYRLRKLRRDVRKLLENAVLLLPTCGGTWTIDEVRREPFATNRALGRYTHFCNLLDLSALTCPAGEADERLPFGVTWYALAEQESLLFGAEAMFRGREPYGLYGRSESGGGTGDEVELVVCGLHMRGFPLEQQMSAYKARWLGESRTAPVYRMVVLPLDPPRPGLVRVSGGGASVVVERWAIPVESLGRLVESVPPPLVVGKVELEDGRTVCGFLCEAWAAESAEDITRYGGFRAYCESLGRREGVWNDRA